jgi:SNF2 family DNA or RNA helicase
MADGFFDENILSSAQTEYKIVENYKDFSYSIVKDSSVIQLVCKIGNERLNSSELKAILSYDKQKNFLSESDKTLLNYIVHRIVGVQTIYKVMGDIDLILGYLKDSNFDVYFNNEKIKFDGEKKLDLTLEFENECDILLKINNDGEFLFSQDHVFFIEKNTVYNISGDLPTRFYREITEGQNKFSIDTFFTLKDTLIKRVNKSHNLKMSEEVSKLSNLKIEEKTAESVLEVGRTSHFIVLELKYIIGSEYFEINKFKCLETADWIDKPNLIKIVREEGNLVKYISDTKISEFIFDDVFSGSRIRYNKSSKSPFLLMLPIGYLDKFNDTILPLLEKHFNVVYKNGQKIAVIKGDVEFEVESDLKAKLNLFEFKVKFKVGNEYFDLDFLKNLISQNKKFIQLKDGTTVNIENIREINKWIEFLSKFEFNKKGEFYKTESTIALELDEFVKSFREANVKSNDEYKNLLTELKERKPVIKIDLPEEVVMKLRDYQREGVYWMHFLRKYGFGGILADEMGLGKTVQALTILSMNKGIPHLVVCPKTLIYNWENEAKIFFPNMKILVVDGDVEKRKRDIRYINDYDVIITSYTMLQKDYVEYIHNKIYFNYMILDEAHYVKNMKTLSAKAVRVISAQNKILLTGTPLENNLDELYSAFDIIMPDYLGNKTNFSREFASKIERNNTIALELLQAKIRPFILRRTKKEVLKELPDKQEQTVYSEMTNKQVAIYNELLLRVKNEVNQLVQKQGFDKSRIQVLSALLKLRQICNHPALLDKSFNNEIDISGKYEMFKELLEEVIESGEKVLVFSQFTSMLDIFEKYLIEQKITYSRLDGSTKNRQEIVDEFNNDESIKVFLISLKAGGVGLNLTSASAVFLYDPWWNPMVEKQAMDRAHRIGQKNTVNIYKFITRNSIEEKILKLQERKGNLFENLVTENAGFIKKLEWDDLMELFE